jgi:hypothetical protein
MTMIERMARAFVEAECRDATDIHGNPITWETEGEIRRRHILGCMREVLRAMKEATEGMLNAPTLDICDDLEAQWAMMIGFAAEEFDLDQADDGIPERIRERIAQILSEP